MDPVDLNELRSIEELRNHQQGVKDEITHLEEEFRGLPLPEDQRDHYRSLVETNEEIDKRVTELDKREKYLKHIASNGGSDQSRVTPAWEAPKEDRSSLKERDIYDLSGVRFNPEDPERGRQEYRDRAMRAIELAHFPTGVKRDEATEYISLLLDEFDTDDGQLARRILKTGAPRYRAAFRKWMSGVPMTNEEQRAFSLGTTGIPITFTLDPTLIPVSASVVNPLRAISNVEPIVGTNEWRGTTAAAITASRAAEGAVTTDNTPTLAQPAIV